MLTLRPEQMAALRADYRERQLTGVRARLEPLYLAIPADRQGSGHPAFATWFDDQLAAWAGWGVDAPGNIESLCRYAIVYYPQFPAGEPFAACRAVLADAGLDEDVKVDKINHRLLFVR